MVEIPENACTINDLFEWYKACEELAKVKAREALLRGKVFKHFFPNPKEGTNTLELDDVLTAAGYAAQGWQLKGVYSMNRSIDEAALQVLDEEFKKANIPVAKLIKRKPELVKSEYNELTEDERNLFDRALVVKPGMPALEVVLPAKRKAKG